MKKPKSQKVVEAGASALVAAFKVWASVAFIGGFIVFLVA